MAATATPRCRTQALHLQPWRDPLPIFDALRLGDGCHVPPPAPRNVREQRDSDPGTAGSTKSRVGGGTTPTLHVAPPPHGSDTHGNGSLAAPFATPHRARDHLRVLRDTGAVAGPAVVLLRNGTYHFGRPLLLGPDDSHTTYTGDRGGAVVSGGKLLDPVWRHVGTSGHRVEADVGAGRSCCCLAAAPEVGSLHMV